MHNIIIKSVINILIIVIFISCKEDTVSGNEEAECTATIEVNTSRGECNETLNYSPQFDITVSGDVRTITTNNIPNHEVGLFGNSSGSLNPHTISDQNSTYNIDATPEIAANKTALLADDGPLYSFGVLLNGVEVDPIAAEPWPHEGFMAANVNWEWNLEATMVSIGLDCNNAHVQPSGKYHYHASPTLYLAKLNASTNEMTLLGYAADGFPIYNKYGYSDPDDNTSGIRELKSSYSLKDGERPGDGVSAPCGEYTGVYSADFEYIAGSGDLDECNGRTGITPEYPNGTYYYVITDDFPNIPRYFRGIPSNDFRSR